MKPIYKNPFCKLQTMNDLDKKSFSQSYNELKFKVKILIIDDQKFSFLDEMTIHPGLLQRGLGELHRPVHHPGNHLIELVPGDEEILLPVRG